MFLALGVGLHEWACAVRGQGEEDCLQQPQSRAAGVRVNRSYWLALRVEVCGKRGQPNEGITLLGQAWHTVQETGEGFWEAELSRLQGELLLASIAHTTPARSRPLQRARRLAAEAEGCFRQAIATARRQGAKSLELRAVMSLSRLWQQQGRHDEARQMLAEIYGWFTEGWDTPDLQEAQRLLESLR